MEASNESPTLLLWGDSGSGKSSLINCLAGRKLADEGDMGSSCTFQCRLHEIRDAKIRYQEFRLLDTVGIRDTGSRTDLDVIRLLCDYCLLNSTKKILSTFDGLLFCFPCNCTRTDLAMKAIGEISTALKMVIDQKSIILVATFVADLNDKVLEKKKTYLRDRLPGFQIVFWDSRDPVPDQFEALAAAISKATPINIQVFGELEQRMQGLAKAIQETDVIPVLYRGTTKIRALLDFIHHHESQSVPFVHTEKTSGYGFTTIITLGVRKLWTSSEIEWFKYKPAITQQPDPIDLKIRITGVKSTPSSGSVSSNVTHNIEGNLIVVRSEMEFPASAFGQYEVVYKIDYDLEYKLPTYSVQPGEKIVMEKLGCHMEKYLQEARADVLIDYFRTLKKGAQQQ